MMDGYDMRDRDAKYFWAVYIIACVVLLVGAFVAGYELGSWHIVSMLLMALFGGLAVMYPVIVSVQKHRQVYDNGRQYKLLIGILCGMALGAVLAYLVVSCLA